LNQLANLEENVETETAETAVTVVIDVGVKEAEDHHQETNASSAEELAIGKNQYNN
jgi:hypothetical protein